MVRPKHYYYQEYCHFQEEIPINKSANNKMNNNDKYTIGSFEKWLNADQSRKRGLKLWGWVINKVKSDDDLFASLKTGKDIGGWNLSDPDFRQKYSTSYFDFESYYQVFLEWRKEMEEEERQEQEQQETNSINSSDSWEDLIQELSKVSFYDNNGIYYPNSAGGATYYSLSENDLKEIKTAFINQVIKKNPSEWETKEEKKTVLAGMNMRGKVSLLVHNSFKVERSWLGSLKTDCGKIHYKDGFADEEWREIENILTSQKNNQTENNKNGWSWDQIFKYGVIGIVVLIIGLVLWQLIKKAKALVFEKN